MAHTYVSIFIHAVFSTKNRCGYLTPDLQERVWPFMGGIARKARVKPLAIGGIEDHVHLLLSLPPDLAVSKAMQLIKAKSTIWIHATFPNRREFSWQEGYGAFSVSTTDVERTISYIRSQAEHHKKRSFEEEFTAFLKAHSMQYDSRYVFG